jgi:hypothetical protein
MTGETASRNGTVEPPVISVRTIIGNNSSGASLVGMAQGSHHLCFSYLDARRTRTTKSQGIVNLEQLDGRENQEAGARLFFFSKYQPVGCIKIYWFFMVCGSSNPEP